LLLNRNIKIDKWYKLPRTNDNFGEFG